MASFRERVANVLTFADGVSSTAFFLGLGALSLLLSFALLVASVLEPSLQFISGLYGAGALLALARKPPARPGEEEEPLRLQRLANGALASVPDAPALAHRYVASTAQAVVEV